MTIIPSNGILKLVTQFGFHHLQLASWTLSEGGWEIQSVQEPSTYTITDGTRTKTVHVN